VQRPDTAYDTQGNPYRFTSYADAVGTTLVNQVQRSFNAFGQLTAETQIHPAGQQGTVQYTYSNMLDGQGHYANHSRPTGMVYPNGRTVTDSYGTAGGLDDSISRLDALIDQGGAGPTLEALTYLGLNTVVQRAHPEANLTLSYINAPGGSTDGGDQYTGLDRFGRVVDQYWSVGATATDNFQYGYDRDSNPLTRTNALQGALSEQFGYDGLNRVTSFTLGSHSQSWVLDSQGNWQTYTTDGQGQTRTHNAQNQITSLTQPGLGTPGYDADGNTTTDEYGDSFRFDAWNRLVRATTAGGTAYGYSYDALGRRITSQVNSGTTTDLFYSANWQVVEEQVNGAMTAQYVWSPVYVDALVERDTPSGRLYVQQDAGWDVTAVVSAAGAVQERYAYNPYGKAGFLDPTTWQVHGGGTYGQSSVGWAYLHQGGRYERYSDKAGTYLFRHRDYSPTLGRWLQQDPLAYAGSRTNLYQDAASNPVMYVDPMGLSWSSRIKNFIRWTAGVVGGAAAAALVVVAAGFFFGPVGIVVVTTVGLALAMYATFEAGWVLGEWLSGRDASTGNPLTPDELDDRLGQVLGTLAGFLLAPRVFNCVGSRATRLLGKWGLRGETPWTPAESRFGAGPRVPAQPAEAPTPPTIASPYQVHIDPITGRGPMAIDTSVFMSGEGTLNGGICNPNAFWRAWADTYGDTLSPANEAAIAARRSPIVDQQWITTFPEQAPYQGETLIHHQLGLWPVGDTSTRISS
jgi:RHS repeat-associated protein